MAIRANGTPSESDCPYTLRGELITPEMPIKSSRFITLEPIMFPSPRSDSFFIIAIIAVTNSGSDVPRLTMVSPIMVSEIPIAFDKLLALLTSAFAPTPISVAEKIKSNIVESIFEGFVFFEISCKASSLGALKFK